WLLLLNMRNVAVAIMIGVVELGKSIVVRRTIDSNVIDSNLLQRLQIIVNDHPPRSYNRHFADFSRLEPTALDSCEFLVAERKGKIRDILDTSGDMRVTLAIKGQRQFTENMEDDGNVVWREVPNHVDIFLK